MEEVDETDDMDEARCGKTMEEDVEGRLKGPRVFLTERIQGDVYWGAFGFCVCVSGG